VVRARQSSIRHKLPRERAEAALHPVADHGPADLLGDGEADADRRVAIGTIAHQQDEAGHGRAPAAIGRDEIRAAGKRS
jgi:hypothetical protein